MHSQAELEVVTGTIQRLEAEVDERLRRIRNLKLIKERIIRELHKEDK